MNFFNHFNEQFDKMDDFEAFIRFQFIPIAKTDFLGAEILINSL